MIPKKSAPAKREALYESLTGNPEIAWAVATADREEIDRLNILRATHLAMRRAVEALSPLPDHCLIDGLPVRDFPLPHDAHRQGGRSIALDRRGEHHRQGHPRPPDARKSTGSFPNSALRSTRDMARRHILKRFGYTALAAIIVARFSRWLNSPCRLTGPDGEHS